MRNAYFNVERLGAIIRRYVHNQYGTTTSHLHAGLPTDRCIAEWWIGSERAQAIVDGRPYLNPVIVERIEVPGGERTREMQAAVAAQFDRAFARGLVVVGVERSGTYLLAELP